jgi:DNA invertase Pin-like site-specific DNA recombinase
MRANLQNSTADLDYTGIYGADYVIGAYSRLSEQDDDKDVSNSIKNQMAMIRNYAASHDEFANAKIIDYSDDGISGSHTDREAYQRLMADVKRGAVHCIIVKDLSRIGRNLIDVDDLLMNYLVVHGIRFIAINNYYDSLKNPLSNLELAV